MTVKAFSKQVHTQIREDLQSLSQSDKSSGVFIGECLCFYLQQPLSFSYHVQHSLEFQPLIIVSFSYSAETKTNMDCKIFQKLSCNLFFFLPDFTVKCMEIKFSQRRAIFQLNVFHSFSVFLKFVATSEFCYNRGAMGRDIMTASVLHSLMPFTVLHSCLYDK